MTLVDPAGTLWTVASFAMAAGLLWAVLATLGIYLGATRVKPRVAAGRVWQEWRRRKWLWTFGLLLPLAGVAFTSTAIWRNIGLRDLFWAGRSRDLLILAQLGGVIGYLLLLWVITLVAAVRRRKPGSAPAGATPASPHK